MEEPAVLPILQVGNRLGESARFDAGSGAVHWVDIPAGELHCLSRRGEHAIRSVEVAPGFVAVEQDGGLLVGGDDSLLSIGDQAVRRLRLPGVGPDAVINDGTVHPSGKALVFGTRHVEEREPAGRLFVLTSDGLSSPVQRFTVFNGPAFSPDGALVYFTDSPSGLIWVASFDLAGGRISERRLFAEVPASAGFPDGMAVDEEGCLWSAHWDGGRLTRYRPDGSVERVLSLPVRRPTSLAFAGPDRSLLVLTSAWEDGQAERTAGLSIAAGDLLLIPAGLPGPASPRLAFDPLGALARSELSHVE